MQKVMAIQCVLACRHGTGDPDQDPFPLQQSQQCDMEADFLSMHSRNITYHPRRPHPH